MAVMGGDGMRRVRIAAEKEQAPFGAATILVLVASYLLVILMPCPVALGDDWADCNAGRREDAPRVINACSRIIPSAGGEQLKYAHRNRGQAYVTVGKVRLAIEDFTAVIAMDAEDQGTFELRGNAYLIQNEADRAIEDFEKVIELSQREDMAYGGYLGRAEAYELKGQFDRAIADYQKAISAHSAQSEAINKRIDKLSKKIGTGSEARK